MSAATNESNTMEQPLETLKADETFLCKARRRKLQLKKCLDDYLDANAFRVEKSVCYRCPLGAAHRKIYAGS